VEGLEARWVPATIKLVAGNLFVSNQTGTLTLETTATAGQIKVTDGANVVTVNGVGGLISITGTNKNDTVLFKANAGGFGGNLLVNLGNGRDAVVIGASSASGIGGNVTVLGGNGNDLLTTQTGVPGTTNLIWGSLTFIGGLGANLITTTTALVVNGSASLVNPSTISQVDTLSIGGNLSITQTSGKLDALLEFDTSIGGNLSVTCGTGSDGFTASGAKFTVGGNATFNMGGGASNGVALTLLTAGSSIGGNLSANFGEGNDSADLGAFLSVGGNAYVNLGEGNNLAFTDVDCSINGSLYLTAGNGDNVAWDLDGTVAGDMNIRVGNGTNAAVTISTLPAGTVFYRAGNGTNELAFDPAAASFLLLDAVFGTGTGTLTLDADLTVNGRVVGTSGTYTFNQNGATLEPTLQLINFP
jgi:hypothetical protein